MGWLIGLGIYLIVGIAITILQMIPFRDLQKYKTTEGRIAKFLLGTSITLFFPLWLIYVGIQVNPKRRYTRIVKDILKRDYQRNHVLRQLDKDHTGKSSNILKNVPTPSWTPSGNVGTTPKRFPETKHQHTWTENTSQ